MWQLLPSNGVSWCQVFRRAVTCGLSLCRVCAVCSAVVRPLPPFGRCVTFFKLMREILLPLARKCHSFDFFCTITDSQSTEGWHERDRAAEVRRGTRKQYAGKKHSRYQVPGTRYCYAFPSHQSTSVRTVAVSYTHLTLPTNREV